MAEPQPAEIKEGDQTPSATPSSSEDRKTAAALSNLDANVDNDMTSKQADTEALGKAMKDMNVNDGPTSGAQKANVTTQGPSKAAVKVNPADVTLLVSTSLYLKDFCV